MLFSSIPISIEAATATGTTGATSFGITYNVNVSYSFTSVADKKSKTVTHLKGDSVNVHYFAKSGETLKYTDKNQWGYCIQPEASVTSEEKGQYGGGSAAYDNLQDYTKETLNYIIVSGFKYASNDVAYYYATQQLIHELVASKRYGDSFNVTNAVINEGYSNGRLYGSYAGDGTCTTTKINNAYKDIVKRVKSHLAVPSFSNLSKSSAPTYYMPFDNSTGKYKLTLTDTQAAYYITGKKDGNALQNGTITCSDPNVNVTQSGNKVTLTSVTPLGDDVYLTYTNANTQQLKNSVGSNKLSIIVPSSGNQAVARGADVIVRKAYTKIKTKQHIHLQLIKTSANEEFTSGNDCYSLEGAVYGIYRDKACTDIAGQIITDKDGYGAYTNSSGSISINTATVDKDSVVYNKASGTAFAFPSDLEKYYAKEITAPKGFELNETVYEFKDSGSVSSDGITILRAYNPLDGSYPTDNPVNDPIGIVLQKRNAVTGESENQGLEGAVFEVQYYAQSIDKDYTVTPDDVAPSLDSANLKRSWYIVTNKNGFTALHPDRLSSKYTSDEFYYVANSRITTLPIGTVVIREIEAPDGYKISDTVFYHRITEEGANIAQETNTPIEVPIDEEPAVGYIGIRKMDEQGNPVVGAKYGLYSDAEATNLLSILYTTSNVPNIFGYDKATINTTFYIKEISAPDGYTLDDTIYPIIPTEDNVTVATAIIQDIYEESIKGSIVIKKTSNDGIVSNMYFAITDNSGNEYNAVATDETGTATVTGLPVYDSKGNKISYTVRELGFKTTTGTKKYGGYSWTVRASNCIPYKGALYEGVANSTFTGVEYAYSRYYYGNKTEAEKNSKGYTKTLVDNSSVTYSFNNTVPTTDIEVVKNSFDGIVENIYFDVIDNTGNSYGYIQTDSNGYASYYRQFGKYLYSFLNVPNSSICIPKKYKVEEIGFKNPGNSTYYLPDAYYDKVITEYKSDNLNVTDDSIAFSVYNEADLGKVIVNKQSEDNNIENLYFKVSAYDDEREFGGDFEPTNIGYDINGNPIHEFIISTNSEGVATSDDFEFYDINGNVMKGLPVYVLGTVDFEITYEISELGYSNGDGTYSLPERYVKNEDVHFNLLDNRTYNYNCNNVIIESGKLQIEKTSDDNVVEGIWFNITATNYDYSLNIVTDETGKTPIIDDLPIYVLGTQEENVLVTYKITELGIYNEAGTYSIPNRYNAPLSKTVTLNVDNMVTVSYKNVLKKGSVTLHKQDLYGNKLQGSEWKLYKSDDTQVSLVQTGSGRYFPSTTGVTTLSTDTNGELYIYDLPQGDYYFIESSPPTGYNPYGNKIEFTITAENSDDTLSCELIVKDYNIFIANTGGSGTRKIYYAGLVFMAISILAITIYIRNNHKAKHSKNNGCAF